jgi:hypothetical protein
LFKHKTLNGAINEEYQEIRILDEAVILEAAPEPSNIVWENLEVNKQEQNKRALFSIILIAIFVFLTFLLFTVLKSESGKNKLKYPTRTNCGSIDSQFVDDQDKYARLA